MRTVEREIADHDHWRQRAHAEMDRELAAVNEEMVTRGAFDSSIRIQEREAVIEKYRSEGKQELRRVLRAIDDAFAQLGPIERVQMRR